MRLLQRNDAGEIRLTEVPPGQDPPKYAILSHTWGAEEVSFKELMEGNGNSKRGYYKIRLCGEQAWRDGLRYFWVDTCCIDKSSSAELSEAINCMFRWYHDAARCYAYLEDVSTPYHHADDVAIKLAWETTLRKSRWFTRGWTLQELIAPISVHFFSKEGIYIGNKISLEQHIHDVTKIPIKALRGGSLYDFSVSERLAWAENRETTREEDKAYSLLGIFDIQMPLIYGERREKAFKRLLEEIGKEIVVVDELKKKFSSNVHIQPQLTNIETAANSSVIPPQPEIDTSACLNTLRFSSMDDRLAAIDAPTKNTCSWLFEHRHYIDWLSRRQLHQHQGLLWIKGNPGSGKSTLMKAALKEAARQLDSQGVCIISFCFNAKGGELERSQLGLFRSLLYQLLKTQAIPLTHFVQAFHDKFPPPSSNTNPNGEIIWHERELKSYFRTLFKGDKILRTLIFVDALDECNDTEQRELAYFLRELTSSAYDAGIQLDVCLSSRHFPAINLRKCPEIVVEHFNRPDIATFVDGSFSVGDAPDSKNWLELRDEIVRKSAGIFLWAVLATNMLLDDRDKGRSMMYLKKRLSTIPPALENLFGDLLRETSEDLEMTVRFFQWIILAARPLRLREWHHILAFIRDEAPNSLAQWQESEFFTEDDEQLIRRIRTISRGLVGVADGPQSQLLYRDTDERDSTKADAGSLVGHIGETRVVQVIHESVREFFLQRDGFAILDSRLQVGAIGKGHVSIMNTCLDYLQISELDALVEAREVGSEKYSVPGSYRPPSVASFESAGSSAGSSAESMPDLSRSFRPTASTSLEFPTATHNSTETARFPHWDSLMASSWSFASSKSTLTPAAAADMATAMIEGTAGKRESIPVHDLTSLKHQNTVLDQPLDQPLGQPLGQPLLLNQPPGLESPLVLHPPLGLNQPLVLPLNRPLDQPRGLLGPAMPETYNTRLPTVSRWMIGGAAPLSTRPGEQGPSFNWPRNKKGLKRAISSMNRVENTTTNRSPRRRKTPNGSVGVGEPLLVFESLKNRDDNDSERWSYILSWIGLDEVQANQAHGPIAQSIAVSRAMQSQILEAFPALLDYAKAMIVFHAHLAEKYDANPEKIVARLHDSKTWRRYVLLTENIELGTSLISYCTEKGYFSWVKWLMSMGETAFFEFCKAHKQGRMNTAEKIARLHITGAWQSKAFSGLLHDIVARVDTDLFRTWVSEANRIIAMNEMSATQLRKVVNQCDHSDQTPLLIAASSLHTTIIKELLEMGADPNQRSAHSALHILCYSIELNVHAIQLLLDHGADPNVKDGLGSTRTALHILCDSKEPNVHAIQLLLDHGADPNAKDSQQRTPLLLICRSIANPVLIAMLLDHGAEVNCEDVLGVTPLSNATGHPDVPTIRLLLEHGAVIGTCSNHIISPWFIAAHKAQYPIRHWQSKEAQAMFVPLMVMFLDNGAHVNALDDKKRTALHFAVHRGDAEMGNLLVQRGADVNLKDELGDTPLHMACADIVDYWTTKLEMRRRKIACIEMLLRVGAFISEKNMRGDTPIDIAQKLGDKNIIKVLNHHVEGGDSIVISE